MLSLGKYKEIVFAVALFLLFDLGVLVINYYNSFALSQDAIGINLAGRQRMLSQKMTKETLALATVANEQERLAQLANLEKTIGLFHSTLQAFANGGKPLGTANVPVDLKKVEDAIARTHIDNGLSLWQPIALQAEQLFITKNTQDIELLKGLLLTNNLLLLKEMNSLTTRLEALANDRAGFFRLVQGIGITLVTLNFFLILFHFINRLRRNDQILEKAQREQREILDTVNDGLFLLDAAGMISGQRSRALHKIFPINPALSFLENLKLLVSTTVFKTASDYLEVLFNPNVEETLIGDLNPLSKVNIYSDQQEKVLSFHFRRVCEQGKIIHLLVTINDITEREQLTQALALAEQKHAHELALLLELLHLNPKRLGYFLTTLESELMQINTLLQKAKAQEKRELLRLLLQKVHYLKGEAAMLEFSLFAQAFHALEEQSQTVLSRQQLTGEDFLPLLISLNHIFEKLKKVKAFIGKIQDFDQALSHNTQAAAASLEQDLQQLAKRLAADTGKSVELVLQLDLLAQLPLALQKTLRTIAVQSLRNSVVHGLESASERQLLQKNTVGKFWLVLDKTAQHWLLRVGDDGRGIVLEKLKKALVDKGLVKPEDLNFMQEKELLSKIFLPGFSSLAQANLHAGHGLGMDTILAMVKAQGGQLNLKNRPGSGLEFVFRFPLVIHKTPLPQVSV